MNSSRKLYVLFLTNLAWFKDNQKECGHKGYTLIYRHTFPNDEPPYIMVTYWSTGISYSNCEEDGESISYYLIKIDDAQIYCEWKNDTQREYESYYIEGILTRNADEHSLKPHEYAQEGMKFNYSLNITRGPKIKYFDELPHAMIVNQ